MMRYEGQTLLVLGGVPMLAEMVRYAQSEGATVIVADYHEKGVCKSIADEAWNISTIDTDALYERATAAGVTGIISGFDDFNIRCCRLLADRMNLPFYAGTEQIRVTMDKQQFKLLCVANHVPATPQVSLDRDKLDAIRYPIIVKPVDGSANRGISICRTRADLDEALSYAMHTSKKGGLLAERYIQGPEVGVNYFLQDAKMTVSAMHDRYMVPADENNRHPRLPLAYIYPSKFLAPYLVGEDAKVQEMFRNAGLRQGTLFMQGCVEDNTVYFYEMGYRLNGAKQYQIIETDCGVNTMHALVDYSFYGSMGTEDLVSRINPNFKHCYATLSILMNPGLLAAYRGLDALLDAKDLTTTLWMKPGDVLDEAALGTQKQIALRVTIKAASMQDLADRIDQVYEQLDILDENGNSKIPDRFDSNLLREN